MKSTFYRIATLITIIMIVIGTHTNAQAASSPALVTDKIVNLAYFYKPPANGDATTLAKNFNTFILTRADETFRDQLIANGVNSPILQYVTLGDIMDPGSCTAQPYNNMVAYKIGDFCNISTNHPDWFLLDANGNRIKVDGNYYLMDPGNQEWREFWLSRTRESQEELGWYGVFLDNVEASLSKVIRLGGVPAKYPDNASYQAAVQGFLQYIYTSYFQPQGRPLLANIISLPDAATWFDYLQCLDGAMDEAWAVDWHTGYRSVSEWNAELALAEQTQNNGKYAILISQGDQSNTNRQSFAFASYLLISNGRAAFRYTNYDNYERTWLYPNYAIDLGSPLGSRYAQGNLWKRDFTNGSVTVDPVNHTAQISTTPAEPNSTFTDVPLDHPLYASIKTIYNAGITSGCSTNPLMFCPERNVNRAEMAVFLLRSKYGNNYTPPAATGIFSDVPMTYWAVNWIEQLYNEGITSGCGTSPLVYCPEYPATRAQMVVFLLRAEHGFTYSPPAANGTIFGDVPVDYWAKSWIEQMVAEGITTGCSNGNYFPEVPVTRAQMADFLVRGFNLP